MLFCSGHWNLYGSSEQDVLVQLDTPSDSVQMLYRDIFFISKEKKKRKKNLKVVLLSILKQFQHAKSSDFFFNGGITHLHISIWGRFASGRLMEWALHPKFMENDLFWLRSSAKPLHHCQPLVPAFQSSPLYRAGCRKFWDRKPIKKCLIREGLSPKNWSSFVMSWCLLPFSCLILFPNLFSFAFSLAFPTHPQVSFP